MHRRTTLVLAATLGLFALACSSMTVRADHDSQYDFGTGSTFALFERKGKEPDQPQMSPFVDQRISSTIAAELQRKGLDSTSPQDADLLVTFYTAVRRRVVVHDSGWYGWRRWGWHGGTQWVNSYPEGTLVIDIIDRRHRQLVWRGIGEGAFTKINPSDEEVAKKVSKILASFPPMD